MNPKKIFDNPHVCMYQTAKGFIFAQRKGINSTASLCFKKQRDGYIFLIRYQPLPILNNKNFANIDHSLYPCCITGSMENNQTPIQNCLAEVFEESGYMINEKDIVDTVNAVSTTQMNEIVYHYLIDLSNKEMKCAPTTDGSFFEKISKNVWVSEKELIDIIFHKENIYLSSLAICYLLFKKSKFIKR